MVTGSAKHFDPSNVRRANPSSNLSSISDHDLDACIADLIVQKSKAREAKSQFDGISAFLEEEEDGTTNSTQVKVPNTNKRFLASVIRNVEGHNQTLLRQQARDADRVARLAGHKSSLQAGREVDQRKEGESSSSRIGTSKLRGWFDDEAEEGRTLRDSSSVDYPSPPQLSSRMDKYFSEPISEQRNSARLRDDSEADSCRGEDSSRRKRKETSDVSRHKSERHRRDGKSKHGSSKMGSSSQREHHYQSDRRSFRREESDSPGHGRDREARHRDRNHADRKRRTRDEKKGSASNLKCRERRSNRTSSRAHNSHSSHRDKQTASDTKPGASPITHPPRKVREWDRGKESFAL
ncbi:uncharacterized protein MEPE_01263 [Melanopsichium pennsylvanicum]|uniref:Uncharacterized protein n=2 Tax=Melanopsichium pennsylvanicum TaxID=63383 RepID=A0AAJ4XIB0_9BASI|nr:conserved hypothetical protein [Melanopsichium pennsylvanicum 4]SNX82557.1 uncharacterized protein MEPE_01263 [Melanopsichium pennsylvanicum]